MTAAITAKRSAVPNMTAGEENLQWSAEKGFWTLSNSLSKWLASKSPVMCFLMSLIIAVSCTVSSWLKSSGRDMVQSSQELRMSVSSESSAEIRWSMVGMLQPGAILICWPDLIVSGDSVFVLGQTWLVAILPMEYTTQVLFPRL